MDGVRTPVVAVARRTPHGKEDGVFAETRSEDLSIAVVEAILDQTGLGSDHVDDLMWACAQQRGEQDNNLGRVIAILSELGEDVPAATINRWCASSMQAVMSAADSIAAGQRECIIAGGVENMTRTKLGETMADLHPRLAERYNVGELQMGMTAEKVAERHDISREAQDEYGYRSHQRAAEATDSGRLDDELVPVDTGETVVEEDEGIRRETSLEQMAELPSVFKADGTVTPGNASQISDGAAGVLVTSEAFASEYGLDILGRVADHNVAGVDPTVMGIGPVPATRGLLERTGQSIEDFGLVELNEAFAAQTVYCQRELGVSADRFNVNGGAIAIGHPLGASGARLPVTLLHEMQKRGVDRGLATLCVGFGQGAAVTFERS